MTRLIYREGIFNFKQAKAISVRDPKVYKDCINDDPCFWQTLFDRVVNQWVAKIYMLLGVDSRNYDQSGYEPRWEKTCHRGF